MGENKGGTDCSSAIKYCFNWKIFRFMCLTLQKAPHQKKVINCAFMCCALSKVDHSRFCYDPNLLERLFENPQSLVEA